MNNYIDKQTAINTLIKEANKDGACGYVDAFNIAKTLNTMTSVDVTEVVRCKDCKLSEPGISIVEYWCCYWDNKTLENGYCSYGERKDD